jgi:sulfoxide reductase heme-binding subunit YedZ
MKLSPLSFNPVKPTLFAAALIPLIWLVVTALTTGLGANPIEKIERHTGDWTLNFLMITLAISPLQKITGASGLRGVRRMAGLFAFFYASLHFMAYLGLDQFFDLQAIVEDIVKHKRIIVGFASYVMLASLAVTSSNRIIEKLRIDRWSSLHRLIYPVAAGGVVHYLWLVKKDLRTPLIYASILAVLLALRIAVRPISLRRMLD